MSADFALGALDLCKLFNGKSHREAIWEAIELSAKLEDMGFGRYWLSEHHGVDVAHGSPELLAPVLAGMTKTIRIGIAGVLLRLYSPYKVAENFRLLNTLFPNRIDAGIARGFVTPAKQQILLGHGPEHSFEEKVAELMGYLRGTQPQVANPARTLTPEIWMLGSKTASMRLAAENGAAFSLGLFLDLEREVPVKDVIAEYRRSFRPSAELTRPKWNIAVAGICAETTERAQSLLPRGETGVAANIVGPPLLWRETFERLRDATETTEFIVFDLCSGGVEARSHSYELLSNALH